jgi:predicted acylesterase/phospholipase RssA
MLSHDRQDKLPKTPFKTIALSLSGGGFRATAFHLGVLAYMSTRNFKNSSLLERTRVLSTVSAGTFTGVKYAATLKKGGTIKDCYKELYSFMTEGDLVSEALQYLSDDKNWKGERQRTLINAFASMYHKRLEPSLFGLLWNDTPNIHLREMSFNATEFNFAMPFRFQKTDLTNIGGDNTWYEYIGNKKVNIPVEVAKEIRLADIIAASSAVPFGFEPINFPDDFIHDEAVKLRDRTLLPQNVYDGDKIHYPIGLMDGSINDNQGVDSILMAEARMQDYPDQLKEFRSEDEKTIDLYLISDASPPNMESYIRSSPNKNGFTGKWNFESLKYFGITSAVIGFILLLLAFFVSTRLWIIALSIFGTLDILVAFILLLFSVGLTGLTRKLGVPNFVVKRLLHFDKLKLGILYNMFVNRRKSAMTLVSDVFLKHMRWFSLERVYGQFIWKPRLIMNAIFDLRDDEIEKRQKKYPYQSGELLNPGGKIVLATSKAVGMSTRLWFTQEELEGNQNMPDTLIACGQFTVCFNLLEYMEKYLKHKKYEAEYNSYDDKTKEAIEQLYSELMEDWKKFKKDPYWMVREWNKN